MIGFFIFFRIKTILFFINKYLHYLKICSTTLLDYSSSTPYIKLLEENCVNLIIKAKLYGLLVHHQVLENTSLISLINMVPKLLSLPEMLINSRGLKKLRLTLKKLKLLNSIWPNMMMYKKLLKISSLLYKNKEKNLMLLYKMLEYLWDVNSKIIHFKIIWPCLMLMLMVHISICNASYHIWFKIRQAKLLV